ncbi:MAG: T9SS type A sorting domain-containing protein [Calditrichia bacterium]
MSNNLKNKRFRTGWLFIFWSILLCGIVAWAVSGDPDDRQSLKKNTGKNQTNFTEDVESFASPQNIPARKITPPDPLSQAIKEARQRGDEAAIRELEKQIVKPDLQQGDAAGPLTHRKSNTKGFPGEPFGQMEAEPGAPAGVTDWGTDIHVRGVNTNFQESYPALATASNGDIYCAWENVNSTSAHDYIQIYRSTDDGQNWTAYGFINNSSFDLSQPSLAIGEGGQDLLVVAYVVNDAVPYIEVATSPLGSSASFTSITPPYYNFWTGYSKPNVWTDSYDYSGWYIYLTAEAHVGGTTNYNIVFWRSTDFGSSYTDPAGVPLGNSDPYTWQDPDGTYGTTGNDIFIAAFNATDNYLYVIKSTDYGGSWSDTVQVREVNPLPTHAVDPDIEAAVNEDNIMLTCTKSFNSSDNIGHTYSTDAGNTWSSLFSLEGYTSTNEFAVELTANEGGGNWHLVYTTQDWWVKYSTRPQDLSAFWQPVPDVVNDVDYGSAGFTKKGITSNWATDIAGAAWSDYRDGSPDYDIYFDISEPPTLYKGPAAGSIPGGVCINTNSLADADQSPEIPANTKLVNRPYDRKLKSGQSSVEPAAPVGANEMEDPAANTPSADAPTLVNNFQGPQYDFAYPPDPIMAVGPDHVVGLVNSQIEFYTKNGTLQKSIDAGAFFNAVVPGSFPCDPQIVYDHYTGRFVMIFIACGSGDPVRLLLAVSDDSNPNGVWCTWALPGDYNGSTFTGLFNDYPKLGLDSRAVYVSANMFSASYEYSRLRVIPKAQLLTGSAGPVTWNDLWDLRYPSDLTQQIFTIIPALTFDYPSVEYLMNVDFMNSPGNFANVWELNDPLGTPSLTAITVPVTAFYPPPNAQQLGGGGIVPVDVGGQRNRNLVYKEGNLWTTHCVGDVTGTYSRVRYLRIDAGAGTVMEDISYGATNYWYFYPAIMADIENNIFIGFSRSGTAEYVNARFTGHQEGDPPGLEASALLKAGEAPYEQLDGIGRNRWGDYSGIALDPDNPYRVWTMQEYSESQVSGNSRWGTWIGQMSFNPFPPPKNLTALPGYDHAVPLYWDPPGGITPLESPDISVTGDPQFSALKPEKVSEAAEQDNSPEGAGSTEAISSYNIYRSTNPGGPYSLIANVNRQYYRDLSAGNGVTYYYVVRAVYPSGLSNTSNEESATPVNGGNVVVAGNAASAPTINGSFAPGEWANATVVDITNGQPNPVRMFLMNDANFLYLAIDDQNNTTPADFDEAGIYFDDNHNYNWPLSLPSSEGNFWLDHSGSGVVSSTFRELAGWTPANLHSNLNSPAPGVMTDIGFSSGNAQFEAKIDLSASALNAAPGDDIGFYLFSLDNATFTGNWPELVNPSNVYLWAGPYSYGTLILNSGTPPTIFTGDFTVADNCGNNFALQFGTAAGATDGYDPLYDQLAPPPPPPGAFDARFRKNTNDFFKDFRGPVVNYIVWDVMFQPASGCNPITLNWNPGQLPPTGQFMLQDISGTNVNMRTHNSYVVTNPGINQMAIVYTSESIFNQNIAGGWNMIGLPRDPADSYYLSVYPGTIPGSCFGWNNTYYNADSLHVGEGYWLRYNSPATVPVNGYYIPFNSMSLINNWNMISGLSCPVAFTDINDPGGILIAGTLFGYSGAYSPSDSLLPGKGYWVRTTNTGTIFMDCNSSKKSPNLARASAQLLNLEDYPSLQISDAGGAGQSLYLNVPVDKEDLLNYSLPPLPPAGGFDARFAGDLRISTESEAVVYLQSSRYPVTLKASGLTAEQGFAWVVEELGSPDGKTHALEAGGEVTLSDPQVKAVKLHKVAAIPLEFSVAQNYPNPFNPETEIRFSIPAEEQVEVIIYNALGQKVRTLLQQRLQAGTHKIVWNTANDLGVKVGSGVYFYGVKAGDNFAMKKMILLK